MQGLIILLFISFALCWKFFENEYESYLENEPTIVRLKNKLIPYFPEISYIRMMKGDSSYTINKQKIYICTESGGDTYDDNMLTYVILHELAHLRRRDALVEALLSVLECLLFFHPAIWWLSRQVREAREQCCDQEALRGGASPESLARALLHLAESTMSPAPALAATTTCWPARRR